MVLLGTYIDDTTWELQFWNAGVGTVRPTPLGGLEPGGRTYQEFWAGGIQKIYSVSVTVSGRMASTYESFTIDGEHNR